MTAAYQDGQDDTDLIEDIRLIAREPQAWTNGHITSTLVRAAKALESRNAEVSALREVIEKAANHELSTYGRSETYLILASVPAVASPETGEDADEGYVSRFRENPNAKNGFRDE